MPRTRRTITVQLDPSISDEDYAKLANVIWLVATMSDSFHGVQQDDKANRDYLNDWYDDDGRSARWS
ncbi:hypothetical protein [Micromonospora sp. IBSANI012]|uniref:hypothetical protein n=1 Tax=Micromonospora sp. IBSANI012 TaxID=3457761 RepID=UPI00405925B7